MIYKPSDKSPWERLNKKEKTSILGSAISKLEFAQRKHIEYSIDLLTLYIGGSFDRTMALELLAAIGMLRNLKTGKELYEDLWKA